MDQVKDLVLTIIVSAAPDLAPIYDARQSNDPQQADDRLNALTKVAINKLAQAGVPVTGG